MSAATTDQAGRAESCAYRACVHCGTPFSLQLRPQSHYCCNGCEYVHRLIQSQGLDHYYALRGRKIAPVQGAALHPRDYTWLETQVAQAEAQKEDCHVVELLLDVSGISCVGCVWLIEKLFMEQSGAIRIEINTQYGQLLMRWRRSLFRPVDFARDIQQFGYVLGPAGKRPQSESRQLLGKLGICGAFALNAMLFTLPRYLGMDPDFALAPLFELLALLFATLSLLTGGSYFIRRGFLSIRYGVLHIDLPIAIGILVAYCGSLFGWQIDDVRFLYFDFVAIFIFLMLTGRWVQERTLENNRNRLLSKNKAPDGVQVVADDLQTVESLPLDALQAGQRMRILPGEVIPVLSALESRAAALSLEWINGESEMRHYQNGQWVPSGAQNIGIEPILLIARQDWQESLLRRLLGARAEDGRNRFADRFLRTYLIVVLLVAVAGGLGWSLLPGDPITALQVIISVLVVSCPCAIGVALPLAQEWAVLHLRHAGVFVRSANLFSKLQGIRHIVFDKTGTLTLEAPQLMNPEAFEQLTPRDAAVLGEMVRQSLHPVSRALREAGLGRLGARPADVPQGLVVEEVVGSGLLARAGCDQWSLGKGSWMPAAGSLPAASSADDHGAPLDAASQTEFRINGRLLSGFVFKDAVRDHALETLQQLSRNYQIALLSGDHPSKVHALAAQLGLAPERVFGGQSPQAKAAFVDQLDSATVFFVGDGANDAIAFANARVRGTPATPHGLLQDQADFYFTGRSLSGILVLLRVLKVRRRSMNRIFAFALTYNVAVVAIALMGHMHPLLAAILMPLSSLVTIFLVALTYRNACLPTTATDYPLAPLSPAGR